MALAVGDIAKDLGDVSQRSARQIEVVVLPDDRLADLPREVRLAVTRRTTDQDHQRLALERLVVQVELFHVLRHERRGDVLANRSVVELGQPFELGDHASRAAHAVVKLTPLRLTQLGGVLEPAWPDNKNS